MSFSANITIEEPKFHLNHTRPQVKHRPLPAETAGNHYTQNYFPASAGDFTGRIIYLRSEQVNLFEMFLQCWVLNIYFAFLLKKN